MAEFFDAPRQAVMNVPDLGIEDAERVAIRSSELAYSYFPRVTGAAAATISPIWGGDWFGVEWTNDSIWFQDQGIKPFTMRALSGKTIPMWVSDWDGELRRKNRKIETRTRMDTGEVEVLIFRKAARRGQRKMAMRRRHGRMMMVDVPASYPGAPGRINRRKGDTDPNAANPGQIAKGNGGVRWRHPGLDQKEYLLRGMLDAAAESGIPVKDVQYLPEAAAAIGDDYTIIMTRQ